MAPLGQKSLGVGDLRYRGASPKASFLKTKDMRERDAHKEVEDLHRRFASYVRSIAYRILGQRDDAEELAQEVFVTAYRSIDQLRDEKAARKWLAVITVRLARRRMRLLKFKSWLGWESDAEAYDAPASGLAPEQSALLEEAFSALRELPANWRLCWVLQKIEGYTLEETAEISGSSIASVKRYVKYAQTHLEEKLHER